MLLAARGQLGNFSFRLVALGLGSCGFDPVPRKLLIGGRDGQALTVPARDGLYFLRQQGAP